VSDESAKVSTQDAHKAFKLTPWAMIFQPKPTWVIIGRESIETHARKGDIEVGEVPGGTQEHPGANRGTNRTKTQQKQTAPGLTVHVKNTSIADVAMVGSWRLGRVVALLARSPCLRTATVIVTELPTAETRWHGSDDLQCQCQSTCHPEERQRAHLSAGVEVHQD